MEIIELNLFFLFGEEMLLLPLPLNKLLIYCNFFQI